MTYQSTEEEDGILTRLMVAASEQLESGMRYAMTVTPEKTGRVEELLLAGMKPELRILMDNDNLQVRCFLVNIEQEPVLQLFEVRGTAGPEKSRAGPSA
jgi:hypothetical protein